MKRTITIASILIGAIAGACEPTSTPRLDAGAAVEASAHEALRDDLPRWLEFVATERVESKSLERELQRPVAELEEIGLRHTDVVRALYGIRKHRPAWVDPAGTQNTGLTPDGKLLWDTMLAAEATHALDPDELHVATIGSLLRGIEKRTPSTFADVRFEPAERRLVEELASDSPDSSVEELARTLARRDGPTPRLAQMVEARVKELESTSLNRARVDVLLSDALVEYGTRLRWQHPAHFREFAWPDHLQKPQVDTRLAWDDLRSARRRLVAKRELMPAFEDTHKIAETLDVLVPHYEQYGRLSEVHREYQQIVEQGGWPELPQDVAELQSGASDPAVSTLKQRLAAEGYWSGDRTEQFGESLRAALAAYQRTHQLWETGTLSRETRASLNVPAQRRLAQIRVAMQRWRESKVGDDDYFVHINIPDFHAELWKGGERKMRFKTVSGATTQGPDPQTGRPAFVHATPTVSSEIEHIVINPYWWVPDDIRRNELEPKLAQEPNFFVENGFEYALDDRGEKALRQRPGAKNALGSVKLLFENPYQIYLHDTPEQQLFKWPARAFSHGCIRLQKPMELAQFLLEQEGRWNDEQIRQYRESGEEKWLVLEDPVPVHVEYYVVRVDDLGKANFLSDLYRENARRMAAEIARLERPAADSAPVNTVAP